MLRLLAVLLSSKPFKMPSRCVGSLVGRDCVGSVLQEPDRREAPGDEAKQMQRDASSPVGGGGLADATNQ